MSWPSAALQPGIAANTSVDRPHSSHSGLSATALRSPRCTQPRGCPHAPTHVAALVQRKRAVWTADSVRLLWPMVPHDLLLIWRHQLRRRPPPAAAARHRPLPQPPPLLLVTMMA